MHFDIRAARADDAPSLAALATQVWLHTYAIDGIRPTIARYVHEHLSIHAFESAIAATSSPLIVGEHDGHLIAYARIELDRPCAWHDSADAFLDKLYVQEHFFGRGVGTAMLDALAKDSARGREIWLTVNSRNSRARRFYERRGYSQVGTTHFDLYGEQHENEVLVRRIARQ